MNHFTRKDAHIDIILKKDVQYNQYNLFDDVDFLHEALPELNYDELNLTTEFLGKTTSSPIIISSMTGGTALTAEINKKLAKCAQKFNIAMGLGSLRPILLDQKKLSSFYVRDIAPDIPLFGNIGMAQIISKNNKDLINNLIDISEKLCLDGMAIHLNPLQEITQPEGDTIFKGCFDGIKALVKELKCDIIVKETGAGINEFIAKDLEQIGVKYIDISGSAGTSWSKVEYYRSNNKMAGFGDWGTHTAFLVATVSNRLKKTKLIASGGIYTGILGAKAIALGADYFGVARPFLNTIINDTFDDTYNSLIEQLKTVMILTGSKNIESLKRARLLVHSRMKELLDCANIDCRLYYNRNR